MNAVHLEQGLNVTLLGLVGNACLAVIKVVSGVLGNSAALVADGVESTADVFNSTVTYTGLRIAARPPDANHPWGHGKADSLAGMFGGLSLLVAGTGVAWEGIHRLLEPQGLPAPFTLGVLLGVVVLKETLYRRAVRSAKKLGSTALAADAWHHRSDAMTSLVALVGILLSLVAGPAFASADAWACLIACFVILFNGVRMLRLALGEIMDEQLPEGTVLGIRAEIAHVEGIHAVEKCLVRKSGMHLLVDVHIEVDGSMSVRDGHELAHRVRDRLRGANLSVLDALVHVEPAGRAASRTRPDATDPTVKETQP
jgi:cation diffusion facilitator family transporter